MAYILITSFLPSFNLLSSNLTASVFLLVSFKLVFRSYNVKLNKNNIFNGGLLIGIASLFFLPALGFALWAFIALAMLRPFRFTEWVVLLLSIATPYYFYAAYLFLTNDFNIPDYVYHLSFLSSKVRYSLWHAASLFLLLAPLLAGFYYVQANSGKMMVHIRKGWYLFVWYILICIPISLSMLKKPLKIW